MNGWFIKFITNEELKNSLMIPEQVQPHFELENR